MQFLLTQLILQSTVRNLSVLKAVKMPAHAHSCDGFKPTDKLTLQVVVDQDTEEITHIQVASLGYSFHILWQCNPRIAACWNVEHDEQLVCACGRVALMLSDCVGSAKLHKFKFVQHNDTGDKEVDSFLPLFIDFTNRTTAAFEDIIADVHYMNCQTEYQLHQLLKNMGPSKTTSIVGAITIPGRITPSLPPVSDSICR